MENWLTSFGGSTWPSPTLLDKFIIYIDLHLIIYWQFAELFIECSSS